MIRAQLVGGPDDGLELEVEEQFVRQGYLLWGEHGGGPQGYAGMTDALVSFRTVVYDLLCVVEPGSWRPAQSSSGAVMFRRRA